MTATLSEGPQRAIAARERRVLVLLATFAVAHVFAVRFVGGHWMPDAVPLVQLKLARLESWLRNTAVALALVFLALHTYHALRSRLRLQRATAVSAGLTTALLALAVPALVMPEAWVDIAWVLAFCMLAANAALLNLSACFAARVEAWHLPFVALWCVWVLAVILGLSVAMFVDVLPWLAIFRLAGPLAELAELAYLLLPLAFTASVLRAQLRVRGLVALLAFFLVPLLVGTLLAALFSDLLLESVLTRALSVGSLGLPLVFYAAWLGATLLMALSMVAHDPSLEATATLALAACAGALPFAGPQACYLAASAAAASAYVWRQRAARAS